MGALRAKMRSRSTEGDCFRGNDGGGAKVLQGTGSIFVKNAQKSPPSRLCYILAKLFRLDLSFRQAEQTKNEGKLLDLYEQLYQTNRQFYRPKVINLLYVYYVKFLGANPQPPRQPPSQKQRKTKKSMLYKLLS